LLDYWQLESRRYSQTRLMSRNLKQEYAIKLNVQLELKWDCQTSKMQLWSRTPAKLKKKFQYDPVMQNWIWLAAWKQVKRSNW
jgi:hypothetical protein